MQAPTNQVIYTVKKGDNLAKIAKEFNTTIAQIQLQNNLETNQVRVGEELKIEAKNKISENVESNSKNISNHEGFRKYIVQKGDSLFSISLKHKTTVANLKRLNNMQTENIQPGMELKI